MWLPLNNLSAGKGLNDLDPNVFSSNVLPFVKTSTLSSSLRVKKTDLLTKQSAIRKEISARFLESKKIKIPATPRTARCHQSQRKNGFSLLHTVNTSVSMF